MNMEETLLVRAHSKGRQSRDYEGLWEVQRIPGKAPATGLEAARRIRVRIKRDSYDMQSYAEAALFDGDKWNVIVSLKPEEMTVLGTSTDKDGRPVDNVSAYASDDVLSEFEWAFIADELTLMDRVAMTVYGS